MSADGAIGRDPIVRQPDPTIEVPLYTAAQWDLWPTHLREAYLEWNDFVHEFRKYKRTLLQDPDSDPGEIHAIDRFLAFALAPLGSERNLVVTDPNNENEEFCFAALGPYGDPLLLAKLFEDTLTHRSTHRDFRDVVTPYMQFLALYDPRYWRQNQDCEPLDQIDDMEREFEAAGMMLEACRNNANDLRTERQQLLYEHELRGLAEHEVAHLEALCEDIKQADHDWRTVQQKRNVLDCHIQIQTQIDEWLLHNRPRRGQQSYLQTSGGTIGFPPLSEFN